MIREILESIEEKCNKKKKEEGVSFSPTYKKMKAKIAGAKMGDCDAIEKEIIQLHKKQKLTSGDFDELEAEVYRKKQSMKKSEADGGYGDLGVVPTAPSKDMDKKKKKMVVGEEEPEDKDKEEEK